MSNSQEPFTLLAQYKNFVPKNIEDDYDDEDDEDDQTYDISDWEVLALDSLFEFLIRLSSVFLMFFFAFGLGLSVVQAFADDQHYNREGQAIIGTVTDCYMENKGKSDEHPVVTYEYMLLDILYIGQEDLAGISCNRYPTGMSLQAQYLASNPSNSRILQEGVAEHRPNPLKLVPPVFCLVVGLYFFRQMRRAFYELHNHASVPNSVRGQPHRTFEPLPSYVTTPSRWLFTSTVFFIAVSFGIVLGISGLLYISYEIADLSHEDAQEMAVTVTACQMQQQEGYDKRPGVTYTYRVLDVPYTNHEELEGVSCDDYPTGTSLNALYDASDPSNSWVVQENASDQTYIIPGVVAFVMCVIAGIASYREIRRSFYAIRNRYYRIDYGTLLDGEMSSITGYTLSKTDEYYVRIRYQFAAPNKKTLKGYTEAHRQDLKDNLPSVGTPVRVLYENDREYMML